MGVASGSSKNFFGAGIETIASIADSPASGEIVVPHYATSANVQLCFTGHAAGSGTARAYIVKSLDGTNFESEGTKLDWPIASGAVRSNAIEVPVEVVSKLKILKITNGDPAQAITNVQVIVTFW